MGNYERAYENDKIAKEIRLNSTCENDVENLKSLLRSIPNGCIITRMKIREAIFWREEEKYD